MESILGNDNMYGYIFVVANTVNDKKYVGKYASVKFSKKYFGDNPTLLADVKKYGADKFTVRMIRACETKAEFDWMYNQFLAEFKALEDSNFYNCEKTEEPVEKPKRSRKKKVIEE